MHANALQRIERHLIGTLQNTAVHDNWPVFETYAAHVQALAAELSKHNKAWISVSDVYSIFIDHVYAALKPLKPADGQLVGPLKTILGDDNVNGLVTQLLNYFAGIPRTYQVYAPLPAINGLTTSIEIAKGFRVLRVVSRKEYPGVLPPTGLLAMFNDEINPPRYFLCFDVQGYCGRTFTSSAAQRALSTFKISMQQATSRGLFKRRKDTPAGLGIFGNISSFTVPKHHLVFVDAESEAIPTAEIELPIEVCRLLDSHSFSEESGQVASALAAGAVDKLVSGYLKAAAQLHLTQKPEALRVKSSIEWGFDAFVNESPTMSFLQTCIALEALYGDDNDGENVTKTLADRCAYLISADIIGRRTIRDKFRSLYSIRSKIVHGSAASLAAEEEHFLDWGRTVLEHSIFKEIKHLALEKT